MNGIISMPTLVTSIKSINQKMLKKQDAQARAQKNKELRIKKNMLRVSKSKRRIKEKSN